MISTDYVFIELIVQSAIIVILGQVADLENANLD